MKNCFRKAYASLAGVSVLSPAGLLLRAVALAVIFAICHLLGWRQHTTFLSGTAATFDGSYTISRLLGIIYLLAYFGFVLMTPILMLTAGFVAAWERVRPGSKPAAVTELSREKKSELVVR